MDASRVVEVGRVRIDAEIDALAQVKTAICASLPAAVSLILGCRGKVIPVGIGTSGTMARRLAHLLAVTGTPAIFLHPADGLHGGLGAVGEGDVVVSISKGGQTSELTEFTRRAKARGAAIIVLTGDVDNEFTALGDVTVRLPTPVDADPGGAIAMGSTLIVAAWTDALAAALMDARRYSWSQVLFTHPGGAVGAMTEDDLLATKAVAGGAVPPAE